MGLMDRVVGRLADRLRLLVAVVLLGAAASGCAAAASAVHVNAATGADRTATVTGSLRYRDSHGWSLYYPGSFWLEHSTSGPGMATFTEVTVANFVQQRAVVTGKTRDGGFIRVGPPLDHAGRFPADGVAFRILLVDGGPAPIGTVADSRFPIELALSRSTSFTHPAGCTSPI